MTAAAKKKEPRRRATVMNVEQLERALVRMAHEIIERSEGATDLALIGMQTRGVHLAERLSSYIHANTGKEVPVGVLDVTLYRDDFRDPEKSPEVRPSAIPFDVDGRLVVLVDDVVYTGRTVRAALDSLMDYGRPRAIQLAVLVDRGHRQLPIAPDYVGHSVVTLADEEILVQVTEEDGEDAVYLVDTH